MILLRPYIEKPDSDATYNRLGIWYDLYRLDDSRKVFAHIRRSSLDRLHRITIHCMHKGTYTDQSIQRSYNKLCCESFKKLTDAKAALEEFLINHFNCKLLTQDQADKLMLLL